MQFSSVNAPTHDRLWGSKPIAPSFEQEAHEIKKVTLSRTPIDTLGARWLDSRPLSLPVISSAPGSTGAEGRARIECLLQS